jgi:predicted DsbA family dithiol-disulfide isomerase
VLRDLNEEQGIGVRNVPAFILVHGGTGSVLAGTRSAEQFVALSQQRLEMAKSGQ